MKRVIQLSCLTMMMTGFLTTVSSCSNESSFDELGGKTLISIPRGGKVINGVTLATFSKETSRAESGGKVSLNLSGVYVNETTGRIETYKGMCTNKDDPTTLACPYTTSNGSTGIVTFKKSSKGYSSSIDSMVFLKKKNHQWTAVSLKSLFPVEKIKKMNTVLKNNQLRQGFYLDIKDKQSMNIMRVVEKGDKYELSGFYFSKSKGGYGAWNSGSSCASGIYGNNSTLQCSYESSTKNKGVMKLKIGENINSEISDTTVKYRKHQWTSIDYLTSLL